MFNTLGIQVVRPESGVCTKFKDIASEFPSDILFLVHYVIGKRSLRVQGLGSEIAATELTTKLYPLTTLISTVHCVNY